MFCLYMPSITPNIILGSALYIACGGINSDYTGKQTPTSSEMVHVGYMLRLTPNVNSKITCRARQK